MRTRLLTSMFATIALSCFAAGAFAQGDPPNPYRATYGWEKMPGGQKLGVVSGVFPDPDGRHLWILSRCGGNDCAGSAQDPILKFDLRGQSGGRLRPGGAGLAAWLLPRS